MPHNEDNTQEGQNLSAKQMLEKEREERRATTLRANLQRRKGQSRSRDDENNSEDS